MRRYDRADRVYLGAAAILTGWYAVAAYTALSALRALPPPPRDCIDEGCWAPAAAVVLMEGLLFCGLIVSLVGLSWFSRRGEVLMASLKALAVGALPAGALLLLSGAVL